MNTSDTRYNLEFLETDVLSRDRRDSIRRFSRLASIRRVTKWVFGIAAVGTFGYTCYDAEFGEEPSRETKTALAIGVGMLTGATVSSRRRESEYRAFMSYQAGLLLTNYHDSHESPPTWVLELADQNTHPDNSVA